MAGLWAPSREDRASLLVHGLRLEAFTLAYNVVEAVVTLTAAWLAGSVALLGFGADSVVESLSAGVLAWRLRREQAGIAEEHIAAIERRAQRLVAVSLVVLGLFVAAEATPHAGRRSAARRELDRDRADEPVPRRHVRVGAGQALDGPRAGQPRHGGRCLPHGRLLLDRRTSLG